MTQREGEPMGASFGEVRSLMQHAPHPTVWERLCAMLERVELELLEREILPYVLGHLERWDDRLRVAPARWVDELMKGRLKSWMKIARVASFGGKWLGPNSVKPVGAMMAELDIRTLDLSGANITDDTLCALAKEPFLQSIRAFRLSRNRLGVRGLQAFVASPFLQNLERLDLGDNGIGRAHLEVLSQAQNMPRLEDVRLDRAEIDDAGIRHILDASWAPRLRTFTLKMSELMDRDVERLLTPAVMTSLRALDLGSNPLGSSSAWVIARAEHLRGLEELRIGYTMIGASGLDQLAASPPLAARGT